MHKIIMGAGYTGNRVAKAASTNGVTILNSKNLNLDKTNNQTITIKKPYGILYTVPPKPQTKIDSRIKIFQSLLTKLPNKVVYLSTSGVYGDRQGSIVSENDLLLPLRNEAKARVQAENLWVNWCLKRKIKLIILRVPNIYGPNRLGLNKIKQGIPLIREKDCNPGNRIHVKDLVSCCLISLKEHTPPGIYNVCDGNHETSTWFTKTVARLANLEPPPEISRKQAEKTFDPKRYAFTKESRILNINKMKTILKFQPYYQKLETGILEILNREYL